MTKTLTDAGFDYSIVDDDTASKLRYYEVQIVKGRKLLSEAVLETGKHLAEVQGLLQSNRVFVQWVETVCHYSRGTVYNFIAAYRAFGNFPKFGNIEPSAMYLLANNEDAAALAMKLAGKGELITFTRAKEIIEEMTVDDEPTDNDDNDDSDHQESIGEQTDEEAAQTGEQESAVAFDPDRLPAASAPQEDCANCGAMDWGEDIEGIYCIGCKHPHSGPNPQSDDEQDNESIVDEPRQATDFERMREAWERHVQPIWDSSDDTARAAMWAWVMEMETQPA